MTKYKLEDNLADGLFGFHEPERPADEEPLCPDLDVNDPFAAVAEWAVKNLNSTKADPFCVGQSGGTPSSNTASGKSKTTPAPSGTGKKNPSAPSDPQDVANIGVSKTRKPRRRNTSFQQWI